MAIDDREFADQILALVLVYAHVLLDAASYEQVGVRLIGCCHFVVEPDTIIDGGLLVLVAFLILIALAHFRGLEDGEAENVSSRAGCDNVEVVMGDGDLFDVGCQGKKLNRATVTCKVS